MSEQRLQSGSPREWLAYARSDLTLARARPEGVLLEMGCFHAQQAAEKSIKAVLISRGIDFPYTHDISHLATLLDQSRVEYTSELEDAIELTQYAVLARYPTDDTPVTEAELDVAVKIAERVFEWAESVVTDSGEPEPTPSPH